VPLVIICDDDEKFLRHFRASQGFKRTILWAHHHSSQLARLPVLSHLSYSMFLGQQFDPNVDVAPLTRLCNLVHLAYGPVDVTQAQRQLTPFGAITSLRSLRPALLPKLR
jgi:hypothetical protein